MTAEARVAALLARQGEDAELYVWAEADPASLDSYHDPEYDPTYPTPTTIRAAVEETREPRLVRSPEGEDVMVRERAYVAASDAPTVANGVRLPELHTADGRVHTIVRVSSEYMGGRFLDLVEHVVQVDEAP